MQLLGKGFIDGLCAYLKCKGFGDFQNETYKYFGDGTKNGSFDRKITPKSGTNKGISREVFITIVLKDFNQSCFSSIESNDSEKDIISEYFDREKKKDLKKHILDFYFKNNVLFCPYCGLNQFQIIGTSQTSSFDLDHFLPKSLFAQFGLSLYNLFPVCKYCNTTGMKGDRNILKEGEGKCIFHPIRGRLSVNFYGTSYVLTQVHGKNFDDIFDCSSNWNGLIGEVFETDKSEYKHHIIFFKLKKLYMQSPHIKNDLNHIKNTYNNIKQSYATVLDPVKQKSIFQSIMEGWYPKGEQEILQYSGGKFKKDVINEISENHFE